MSRWWSKILNWAARCSTTSDSAEAQRAGWHLGRTQRAPAACVSLTRSTAFGLFDGNTVGVIERSAPGWRQRCRRACRASACTVLRCQSHGAGLRARWSAPCCLRATTAPASCWLAPWEPMPTATPSVAGKRAVFGANNDAPYADAIALARAGAQALLADMRAQTRPRRGRGRQGRWG